MALALQATLTFWFCRCRYRTLFRERAVWVLQTTATASLCANPATLRVFLKHNSRSPALGRKAINTEMDKVVVQLIGNMGTVLKRANKVALAAGKDSISYYSTLRYLTVNCVTRSLTYIII